MNLKPDQQSALSLGYSNTPPKLGEVTLAWGSDTPCLNTETNLIPKFAPRNYPHTPEQIAKELRVDENGKLWWLKKIDGPRQMNKPVGSIKTGGINARLEYYVTSINGYNYKNSALAFCLYYDRWPLPGKVIDHINHDTLDDSYNNIREVSPGDNTRNRRGLRRTNKSGVNGVSWDNKLNKWRVQLRLNSKTIYGGIYYTIEAAAKARQQLESLYLESFKS